MKYHLITVDGRGLKLRITAKGQIELEKMLGVGMLKAMQDEDKLLNSAEFVSKVLFVALKPFALEQGRYDMDACYDLYDKLVDDGYTLQEFADMLTDICVESGLFPRAAVEEAKQKASAQPPEQGPEEIEP